jgi:Flp pilus assembly pilin Flp
MAYTHIATRIRTFLRAEDGAVTVDYTVLTAAGGAAAIATAGVLWVGLNNLADTVNNESTGVPTGSVSGLVLTEGFENGADSSWQGGSASRVDGIGGSVLGPIGGGDLIEREFLLTEDIPYTAFQFDLYALDDLTGSSGIIYAQDTEIGRLTETEDGLVFTSAGVLDVDISAEIIADGQQIGGNSGGGAATADGLARITVRYGNPDPNFTIGFGSDGPSGTSSGSFAIDDFEMIGLADPNAG